MYGATISIYGGAQEKLQVTPIAQWDKPATQFIAVYLYTNPWDTEKNGKTLTCGPMNVNNEFIVINEHHVGSSGRYADMTVTINVFDTRITETVYCWGNSMNDSFSGTYWMIYALL